MPTYDFYSFFTATKQGKTGLAVTVDIRRASDGVLVVNNLAAVEVGGGIYKYQYVVATVGDFLAVFKTADVTVDFQHVAQLAVNVETTSREREVDEIWDEILTGATHNVPTSAGRRLRQLASNIVYDGVIVSSTVNSVILDAGASAFDGAYDPALIIIYAGTGIGQCRLILEYTGATRKAAVDRNWRVNPDGTSQFMIIGDSGREHVNEGSAQGGTINTIVLNSSASQFDNAYNGQVILIRSGQGEDQARRVLSYVGATRTCTTEPWDQIPDNTSVYVMLPTSRITPAEIDFPTLPEIWGYSSRTLTTAPELLAGITNDNEIILLRGETISFDLVVGSVIGATNIWFTAKSDLSFPDAASVFQVDLTGLIYFNGATPVLGDGGLTVIDAASGTIRINLIAARAAELVPSRHLFWDVQIKTGAVISTIARGNMQIWGDVTRRTT